MSYFYLQTPNYSKGRSKPIEGIIIHRMAGTFEGAKARFLNNHVPIQQRASAHYLIRQDGHILQMCKDEDTAWHAGSISAAKVPLWARPNPNYGSIGIECEDKSQTDNNWWKPALLQSLTSLVQQLSKKHHIPLNRTHIIGHSDVDPVRRPIDPGKYTPWNIIIQSTMPMTKEEVIELFRLAIHQDPTEQDLSIWVGGQAKDCVKEILKKEIWLTQNYFIEKLIDIKVKPF